MISVAIYTVLYSIVGQVQQIEVLCLGGDCSGNVRTHEPRACPSFKQLSHFKEVTLKCDTMKSEHPDDRPLTLIHTYRGKS